MTSTLSMRATDLIILRARMEDTTQWFLTCDAALARQTLIEMGAQDIAELDPVGVLHQQYDEMALLGTVG